jgi:hypothetical protein
MCIFTFKDINMASNARKNYVGRPHIAQALLINGYIKRFQDAFTNKLIANNGLCYFPASYLTPYQAIRLITSCNGKAVLAHPGYYKKPLGISLIKKFKNHGLGGIEVFHRRHNRERTNMYLEICKKLDLLITGGSDCHGIFTNPISLGKVKIPYKYFKILKESLRS